MGNPVRPVLLTKAILAIGQPRPAYPPSGGMPDRGVLHDPGYFTPAVRFPSNTLVSLRET